MSEPPRVLGVAWLPLHRAGLCTACHKFYDCAEDACPACGSPQRRLVADILGVKEALA